MVSLRPAIRQSYARTSVFLLRRHRRALDRALPELPALPALLGMIPSLRFNGPGQHLLLLGTMDAVVRSDTPGMYQAHVVEGPQLVADGMRRIRAAGYTYHLADPVVARVVEGFRRGAGGALTGGC